MDREARTRGSSKPARTSPKTPTAEHNREAIAARETRIATRLRAIERAYRIAVDPEATPAPELSQILPLADRTGRP